VTVRESELLRLCQQWLTLHGWAWWRANCGAVKVGKRLVRFGTPGQPDLFALIPPHGRLACLELKGAGGRLRPEQRAWLARAEAAGALCVVVRSVEDLVAGLRQEGRAP
jgi:hypothetical protein